MQSYKDLIEGLSPITVDKIIDIATLCVPTRYKRCPWKLNDHGKNIIKNEDQLNGYLAAYGVMHKHKLVSALENFPFSELNNDFEVFDWACGQGLASVCFAEKLREQNVKGCLKKITLIEPSSIALDRAVFNVKHMYKEVSIQAINQYLPGSNSLLDSIKQIDTTQPIAIHFFSNILDIVDVDLKKLAKILSTVGLKSYVICVGPFMSCNNRLRNFPNWFDLESRTMFTQFDSPKLGVLDNGHYYGGEARCFRLTSIHEKPILRPIAFFPAQQFHSAYRLDSVEKWEGKFRIPLISEFSHFDVLAPFDIGAQIYDDVHPILAVANNIITRGLPTKASPFIEELFKNCYGVTTKFEKYGTISYPDKNKVKSHSDLEMMWKVPIAVARIEKVILEAIISERLDCNSPQWNIIAKENDVPCTAIAFTELQEIITHLAAMSEDYSDYRLPEINLVVISKKNAKSPLHLEVEVYDESTLHMRESEWDMVLDVAIDQYSDDEHVQFSEFKAKNECWFNVRSAETTRSDRTIYTSDRIKYKPTTTRNDQGEYDEIPETKKHLEYFLKMIFRKENFRPGQLPILTQAMQLQSVIGLLPTGGGKSLTYQLAALLQPGISIVIDPLRSLMADQYDGLIKSGVDCCTYINSTLDRKERENRERMMEYSKVLIMFMSPERLCIYKFRQRLKNMRKIGVYFAYGVIDEVHCVSEWGQDFRFSYLHLGRNLYQYVLPKDDDSDENNHITLFGLTATASFDVLADVERELSGNGAFPLDENTVVRYENCNRLELQYKVERVPINFEPDHYFLDKHPNWELPSPVDIFKMSRNAQKCKSDFLREYIKKLPQYLRELQTSNNIDKIKKRFYDREPNPEIKKANLEIPIDDEFYSKSECYTQAGIVFCPHKSTTGISVNVNANKLQRYIPDLATFMGSSDNDSDRISMENMSKFRDDKSPIMVATKAFGMGIDKPDVRFTVNLNYSSSLESFVQEAGRAGRDKKMALAIILISDYKLVRIKRDYNGECPIGLIRNKWFKTEDLKQILNQFRLEIPEDQIDICDPNTDMVKIRCTINNQTFGYGECNMEKCKTYSFCHLRHVDRAYRGTWLYWKDFLDYKKQSGIHIAKESIQYLSPDYETNMYFYDMNFKGELEEKITMYSILSKKDTTHFIGNSTEIKSTTNSEGFLTPLLELSEGEQLVTFLDYTSSEDMTNISKAIYRMCCIGLIDDFTQKYEYNNKGTFRIVTTKRESGGYYNKLKEFLLRYFSEKKASEEIKRAQQMKGDNEIHHCLGYLTEFIYEKIAIKRKNALDDIRNFCVSGSNPSQNWLAANEDMKDDLFYYFNSKFARHDYHTPNGELFSLTDALIGHDDIETEHLMTGDIDYYYDEILFKYLRVADDDVVESAGSPVDSVKHLRGAIRLITHRSFKIQPPALPLLNVFCLLYLKATTNKTLKEELRKDFIKGYMGFRNLTIQKEVFYDNMNRYYSLLSSTNTATDEDITLMKYWATTAEIDAHTTWSKTFSTNFCN